MSYSVAQTIGKGYGANPQITIPAGGVPAKDAFLISIQGGTISGISDNASGAGSTNTYSSITAIGSTAKLALYWCPVTKVANAGDKITINTGGSSRGYEIYQITGAAAGFALDGAATTLVDHSGSSASLASSSLAAASFAFFCAASLASNFSQTSALTMIDTNYLGGGSTYGSTAYIDDVGGGVETFSGTLTSSTTSMIGQGFKSAPTPAFVPLILQYG